jgi:hypothetical protein
MTNVDQVLNSIFALMSGFFCPNVRVFLNVIDHNSTSVKSFINHFVCQRFRCNAFGQKTALASHFTYIKLTRFTLQKFVQYLDIV